MRMTARVSGSCHLDHWWGSDAELYDRKRIDRVLVG